MNPSPEMVEKARKFRPKWSQNWWDDAHAAQFADSAVREAVRTVLIEVADMYREYYYCEEYSATSDDFLKQVASIRKRFELE